MIETVMNLTKMERVFMAYNLGFWLSLVVLILLWIFVFMRKHELVKLFLFLSFLVVGFSLVFSLHIQGKEKQYILDQIPTSGDLEYVIVNGDFQAEKADGGQKFDVVINKDYHKGTLTYRATSEMGQKVVAFGNKVIKYKNSWFKTTDHYQDKVEFVTPNGVMILELKDGKVEIK
jgi:hypothetical protein